MKDRINQTTSQLEELHIFSPEERGTEKITTKNSLSNSHRWLCGCPAQAIENPFSSPKNYFKKYEQENQEIEAQDDSNTPKKLGNGNGVASPVLFFEVGVQMLMIKPQVGPANGNAWQRFYGDRTRDGGA